MTATTEETTRPPAKAGGLQVNPDLLGDDSSKLPDGVYRDTGEIPPDREHLFTLDDLVYTAPKQADPRLMFRFLRDARRKGMVEAAAGFIEDILTPKVMDILADSPDLDDEAAAKVFKIITRYMEKNANRMLGN